MWKNLRLPASQKDFSSIHNLHLFANPIDENKPRKLKDKNLIYFGPGIHTFPGDTLNVPSGKTVYVAGGALVKGCIQVVNAQNVKILGRGIVIPERRAGLRIVNSKNVLVEGVITTQCPTGGSDSITITNWIGAPVLTVGATA